MSNIYILQSQNDLYLSKSGDWVSGDDSKVLFRTQHKDEAINQKVELTVKQPELRVSIGTAQLGDKGKLILQKEHKMVLPKHNPTPKEAGIIDEHAIENELIHLTDIVSPAQHPEEQLATPKHMTD